MFSKRKGQSTLEYIALFVAVTVAIVVVIYTTLKAPVENMLKGAGTKISNAATKFNE